MRPIALILAALLAGCAGRPLDLPACTPELIRIIGEAKDAPDISRRLHSKGYTRILVSGNSGDEIRWTPATSDRFIMFWRHFTAAPQTLKSGAIEYAIKKAAHGVPRPLALNEPPLLTGLADAGDALFRRGNYRGAARAYENSRQQAPSLPLLHARLGDCHTRLGNYSAAYPAYSRALAMGGPSPDIFSAMGEMHEKFRRPFDAEDAFEKSAGLDPDNPARWVRLARSRLRNGRKTPAMKAIDQALAIDPTNSTALQLKSAAGKKQ